MCVCVFYVHYTVNSVQYKISEKYTIPFSVSLKKKTIIWSLEACREEREREREKTKNYYYYNYFVVVVVVVLNVVRERVIYIHSREMGGICAKKEEPFFLPEDHPEVLARMEKFGGKKKKSVKDRRHTPANIGDEAQAVINYREEMLKKMQQVSFFFLLFVCPGILNIVHSLPLILVLTNTFIFLKLNLNSQMNLMMIIRRRKRI